ncbi:HAD-IA family hydrolase [Pseudosporangium ferrugineum]|uniref:Putative hydrolase of the HAD superfamily n=1 Tax=Pseudosporangium ferrugineum TaxID=439699 RepID=A0A2T0SFS9_9ACTN|nr:HAD-IA family hydrolase [Pseudosporangium ferrugineum]PRY32265.1 putative hydrolase of the HAD superfamily [Pseudosporangium ferrugineum]
MARTQLLIDFGEVISVAQPAADVTAMADAAGLPAAEFSARYWACRPGYDGGGSARDYWHDVLGAAPGPTLLRRLVELDVASWLHLNPDAMRMLALVHAAGVPVSLLSNAPLELARELDRHPGLGPFRRLLFSADLGLTKPDPAIYAAALGLLGARPGAVVFADDRAPNVTAAVALGLRALVCTGTPDSLARVAEAVLPAGRPLIP